MFENMILFDTNINSINNNNKLELIGNKTEIALIHYYLDCEKLIGKSNNQK